MSSDEPHLIKRWRSGHKFVRRFLCLILALVCNPIGLIFPGSLPTPCPLVLRLRHLVAMWNVIRESTKDSASWGDHLWLEGKSGARTKEKVKGGETWRARVGATATDGHIWAVQDNEKGDLYCPPKDENFTQSDFSDSHHWGAQWEVSWFLMFLPAGTSFDSKYKTCNILYPPT